MKKKKNRKQNRVERICALKTGTFFLKNKFAMLSNFEEGKNLSGWF